MRLKLYELCMLIFFLNEKNVNSNSIKNSFDINVILGLFDILVTALIAHNIFVSETFLVGSY